MCHALANVVDNVFDGAAPYSCPQARDVQLEQRKKANREAEAIAGVAEGAVPKGNTPWERVISVCNFNSEALSKVCHRSRQAALDGLSCCKDSNCEVAVQTIVHPTQC